MITQIGRREVAGMAKKQDWSRIRDDVERFCTHCNKQLSGRRQKRFCSTECAFGWGNEQKKLVNNPRHCITCSSQLLKSSQKRFCSRRCAITRNNKGRDRHAKRRPEGLKKLKAISHPCKWCGTITTNEFYCSLSCSGKGNRTKYVTDEERYKANRAIKNEAWHRYMAKRKAQTPHDADIKLMQDFYLQCPDGHEVDHIIPISRGGFHHQDNLQYLTRSENRKKWKKLPSEMAGAQGFEP